MFIDQCLHEARPAADLLSLGPPHATASVCTLASRLQAVAKSAQ